MRLCGISSRFQLLSPSVRQVTHALLTRPPLRNTKNWASSLQRYFFVRLACVKHAASVHPEPGSNSRYKFVFLDSKPSGFLSLIYLFKGFCSLKYSFEFSGSHCCSFIKVLASLFAWRKRYIITHNSSRQAFLLTKFSTKKRPKSLCFGHFYITTIYSGCSHSLSYLKLCNLWNYNSAW